MSRETWAGVVLLGLVAALLPIVGFGLVPSIAAPIYVVNAAGQSLCFVVLAMSLDLMWGGCGILSLGQGLYFALGGYLMAMRLLRTAYADTGALPDFLQFMGQTQFPTWWAPFDSAGFTVVAIVAVPALVSAAIGYVSFRSRVNGVYLSISRRR